MTTREVFDQREALYESGNWPEPKAATAPRNNTPDGPEWKDGEPVNLAAAAEDADRWLEFLQMGRPLSHRDAKHLTDCRAALRSALQPDSKR